MTDKLDRMASLTNRLQRLVAEDMKRCGRDNLYVGEVLGRILIMVINKDARSETLLQMLGEKRALNKEEFAARYMDTLEKIIEVMQADLKITVDDHGKIVLTRIH